MIKSMDENSLEGDSTNNQDQYDSFRQNTTIDLAVAEEKPLGVIAPKPTKPKKKLPKLKLNKTSALIILIIVICIAGVSIYLFFIKAKTQKTTSVVINTQSLDNGVLNQLTPDDESKSNKQLTISANTLFKNDTSVQGSLAALKNLTVAGTTDLQGPTNIRDNLTVGRALNVGSGLTVNGQITASSLNVGSINISNINVSGDLVFGGHISPSGANLSARTSNASSGGSVSVTGNDTSGTIIITTGGGSASGELAVISFRRGFSGTPKVQLTPINSPASSLNYFATRSANMFTVNSSSNTTANTTYVFDYFVTQ